MKIKAKVRKQDLAKISKSRKCLEIGKDLGRMTSGLQALWMLRNQNPKQVREMALDRASEVKLFGERYPRAKKNVLPVENSLRNIASGKVKMKDVGASMLGMKAALMPLIQEAERSCS